MTTLDLMKSVEMSESGEVVDVKPAHPAWLVYWLAMLGVVIYFIKFTFRYEGFFIYTVLLIVGCLYQTYKFYEAADDRNLVGLIFPILCLTCYILNFGLALLHPAWCGIVQPKFVVNCVFITALLSLVSWCIAFWPDKFSLIHFIQGVIFIYALASGGFTIIVQLVSAFPYFSDLYVMGIIESCIDKGN